MSKLQEIIGNKFVDKSGKEIDLATLTQGKKTLGIYFSAHWCPPCRGFTPDLAEFYEKHAAAREFEIIFASSDRDEKAFNEYLSEQPWKALPYSDRELKAKLSSRYEVSGIPTLVTIDVETGKLLSADGRAGVSSDEDGSAWPYTPKPFWEILDGELESKDGKTVTAQQLKQDNDYVAIYFSAHWCPPCRNFTPKLIEFHEKHAKDKRFQIVFASSDKDEKSFTEYFGTMPWVAIPLADKKRKNALDARFGVEGIPSLVLVEAATGKVVCKAARGRVDSDPEAADFPWLPKPVQELNGDSVDAVNTTPALIALGKEGQTDQALVDAITPLATELFEDAKKQDEKAPYVFFSAGSDPIVSRVRQIMEMKESTSGLYLLDISSRKYFVCDKDTINEDEVRQFVSDHKAGKLTGKDLTL